MRAATFAIACLAGVFLALSLNHFYPSKMAYGLVALTSGVTCAVYWFKSLWRGIRSDWLDGLVIITVAVFSIVLPCIQLLLQAPSLYISAMVFGGLIVGVLNHRLPDPIDTADLTL